nr:YesL family protein [uncultured Blautia sp.]
MSGFFNIDSPIMRFLSRVCDLMILNVLCIICCLPIVTAGASITALYTITMKMVRGEESYIFKGFFKAFKENFKQSTIIWLIMAVLGIFIFVDYQAASLLPENVRNIFRIFIGALIIFYAMILSYVFPYTARFANNLKNIFKNSLLIAILNLPWTILIVVIPAALGFATFLTTRTLVYGSMLWMLMGFAVVAYIESMMFRKIFAKYEPHTEEEVSDPDAYTVPEELPDSSNDPE